MGKKRNAIRPGRAPHCVQVLTVPYLCKKRRKERDEGGKKKRARAATRQCHESVRLDPNRDAGKEKKKKKRGKRGEKGGRGKPTGSPKNRPFR